MVTVAPEAIVTFSLIVMPVDHVVSADVVVPDEELPLLDAAPLLLPPLAPLLVPPLLEAPLDDALLPLLLLPLSPPDELSPGCVVGELSMVGAALEHAARTAASAMGAGKDKGERRIERMERPRCGQRYKSRAIAAGM
jgi:hypothetical protein